MEPINDEAPKLADERLSLGSIFALRQWLALAS